MAPVYGVQDIRSLVRGHAALADRRGRVSRTVVLLGLVSMFTDISSEMISAILPLYLVLVLGFTPFQFGVVDGYQRGASALVSLASGLVADRRRRHKEVAVTGYGLSAVCKLLYLAAGSSFSALGAVVLADRVGKGIRTAPRDALIALSSRREDLGMAFGVHRALDTTGAMLGPLLAFGLLALAPADFDAIFVVSFFVAVIGVGILALLVDGHRERIEVDRDARISLAGAARLVAERRFRSILVAAGVLGVVTISDAFLYLGLQRQYEIDMTLFPLLFVFTALAFMVLAVPAGWLADRIGRGRVLIGGYCLLIMLYASLLLPSGGSVAFVAYIVAFGAFYAATDGVINALAAAALPREAQATGIALVLTVGSLSRLVGSIVFGALWTAASLETAVTVFGAGLVVGIALAAVALRRGRRPAARR